MVKQHKGKERDRLRRTVAAAYRKGTSIREISIDNEISYGKAHTLLVEAGVKIRPQGGQPKPKPKRGKAA